MSRSSRRPSPTRARVFRGTARNLALLARQLRQGELVAAPTETVYGLAANAYDAAACRKIFAAKGRPANDPLIVHLHSKRQLPLVGRPNDAARKLIDAFWPGPLTLILPKTDAIPDVVTAGRDSVAVRMPAHGLFRKLLRLADVPLAAPSANPFGYVSPTTAAHVEDGLGRRIRFILDGGPTPIGVESTIVDVRDEAHPRLLRPGAITREQLERVLRRRVASATTTPPARAGEAQVAPGMLKRHYSPHTPITLHERLTGEPGPREAFVYFRKPKTSGPAIFWLHPRGNLAAAARTLFAMLRRLDAAGFKRLHMELAPGGGLAEAINDRLRRAAAR